MTALGGPLNAPTSRRLVTPTSEVATQNARITEFGLPLKADRRLALAHRYHVTPAAENLDEALRLFNGARGRLSSLFPLAPRARSVFVSGAKLAGLQTGWRPPSSATAPSASASSGIGKRPLLQRIQAEVVPRSEARRSSGDLGVIGRYRPSFMFSEK